MFVHVADGKVHEVRVARAMNFPSGSIVLIHEDMPIMGSSGNRQGREYLDQQTPLRSMMAMAGHLSLNWTAPSLETKKEAT